MDGCGGQGLSRVADALAALDTIAPLPPVSLPLADALHRVLATPARAACDLPPFTQSAVDGYAVRHADLATGALPLAGTVRAAAIEAVPRLAPGTAQRIYTGGMLPDGADTVVRQEHAQVFDGALHVARPVGPGADVRNRGEELSGGATLAPAGLRLTPGRIAALAMGGVARVTVHRAPRIAVLVTGDEVVAPGAAARRPGQIHDANGPLLSAWLALQGQVHTGLSYVGDSAAAVRGALAAAFATSDLVLSTGGVSVGDYDFVPRIAAELGARPLFWKVAQKPGKPVFAALRGPVPLLGLPGNPASVLVNLMVYARRALGRLEGETPAGPGFARGVLEEDVSADPSRDRWLRVALRIDEAGVARLRGLPRQASHMLSNLTEAGALAWIPAGVRPLQAGSVVRWLAL